MPASNSTVCNRLRSLCRCCWSRSSGAKPFGLPILSGATRTKLSEKWDRLAESNTVAGTAPRSSARFTLDHQLTVPVCQSLVSAAKRGFVIRLNIRPERLRGMAVC
jgi:hypothetical protein